MQNKIQTHGKTCSTNDGLYTIATDFSLLKLLSHTLSNFWIKTSWLIFKLQAIILLLNYSQIHDNPTYQNISAYELFWNRKSFLLNYKNFWFFKVQEKYEVKASPYSSYLHKEWSSVVFQQKQLNHLTEYTKLSRCKMAKAN